LKLKVEMTISVCQIVDLFGIKCVTLEFVWNVNFI